MSYKWRTLQGSFVPLLVILISSVLDEKLKRFYESKKVSNQAVYTILSDVNPEQRISCLNNSLKQERFFLWRAILSILFNHRIIPFSILQRATVEKTQDQIHETFKALNTRILPSCLKTIVGWRSYTESRCLLFSAMQWLLYSGSFLYMLPLGRRNQAGRKKMFHQRIS